MQALWIVLLWSAVAWAQPVVPLPPQYQQCTEFPTPTGTNAPPGKQIMYCKAGAGWCARDSSGVERCTGGGGGSGYATIQEEGGALTQRATVNFIGAAITCVDNAGATRTDCTVTSGGAPTFDQIGSGTNITAAMHVGTGSSLDFTGSGTVKASDVVCSSCISLSTEVTGTLPLANLTDDNVTANKCLVSGGAGGDPSYVTCPATGVTSVACGSGTTCTPGSPITTTGTVSIGAGQITDAMLANAYSGVGTCGANNFVTAASRNAAPTCAQPSFTNLSGTATDAQVPDILTLNLPSSTLTGATADTTFNGTGVGTGAFKALPTTGTNGCSGTADKIIYNNSTHAWGCGVDAGAGGGMTSWILNGETGAPQTVTDGQNVTISGGAGITTAIVGTNQLDVITASDERNFVKSGALTCGASTNGKMLVHTTPLQYCDNAATPTLQYAAYGTSAGAATDVVCTSCINLTGAAEVTGTLPVANGGTSRTTQRGAYDNLSPNFNKGDLTAYCANGGICAGFGPSNEHLAVGANGTLLTPDSTVADFGLKWATPASVITPFTVAGTAGTNPSIAPGDQLLMTTVNSINITGSAGSKSVTLGLNSPTCNKAGQALNFSGTGTDTITCQNASPIRIDATAGVDCTGATDSTTGVNNALTAAGTTGATVLIPSNCRLGLASPGAGAAAITVPNNIHIFCADQSAGFFANHQSCHGGTYAGAACNSNTECLSATGNGTCQDDFGHAVTAACSTTPPITCFAPTAATTYTMLKDASAQSSDVVIENCSFWTYQADPFQRCVSSGAHNGSPCRQECDNASGTIGLRCEVNADCGAGTCLRTADCHADAGPGLCGGAPHNASGNATSKINPLDLTRTFRPVLTNLAIYDHFSGDFGIATGQSATLYNDNLAREITDCTSPLPANPSNSTCFSTNATKCCYGAVGIVGNGNVQPTVAVTNDINVGADSQLLRVTARGSTTSFLGGTNARLDECTVWPPGPLGAFDVAGGWGPGTPANGYSVGAQGIVAKSYALNLLGSGTGIALTGGNAGAIANKLRFNAVTSGGTGISATAGSAHVVSNIIDNVTGAGKGLTLTGGGGVFEGNQIVNAAGTTTGISVNSAGNLVKNSQITLLGSGQIGISVSGVENEVDGNRIGVANGATAGSTGISFSSNKGSVIGNIITLPTNIQTIAIHHLCIKQDAAAQQNRIVANQCNGGFRGISTEGTANGTLTNTQYSLNRIVGTSGACFTTGGAGVYIDGNYCNHGTAASYSTVCDAGCNAATRGQLCNLDTDCVTCTNSLKPCIPDAQFANIGDPEINGVVSTSHNTYAKNVVFAAANGVKQCTVAGNIGQICDVASCAGGATCSGTPSTCQSLGDAGKFCCQTAAGATCAVRTATPYLRLVDTGAGSQHTLLTVALNAFFPGVNPADSLIGIDGISNTGADLTLTDSQISDNIFSGASFSGGTSTNSIAIRLPTAFTSIAHFDISDNLFTNWPTPATTGNIANYQGAFGSLLLRNGSIYNTDFPTLTAAAQTVYSGLNQAQQNVTEHNVSETIMVGAGSVWKMMCSIHDVPSNTSTRKFTLRKNDAATTMLCTITNAIKTCTPAAGAASAPIAFADGDEIDVEQVSVVGTTLAATQGTCVLYVSNDTVM